MRLENIPFRLESELFKGWYSFSKGRPSSRPFVSGDSFRSLADHIEEPGSRIYPKSVRRGDIVFVQASELARFEESILPSVSKPFILLTHNGDLNIGQRFSRLADDEKVLHWFAQNLVFRHPKLTAVPIGLENRSLHSHGVIRDFVRLAKRRSRRFNRILYGFTIENNPAERLPAAESLKASAQADFTSRLNSRKYRQLLNQYGFVASPPGNGVDCHRTWEALYLGVVPILKRSPFYSFFPDLPALFVDDWKEITHWDDEFLTKSRAILCPRIESTPYLRFDYWRGLIQEARRRVEKT
jgi:hypothetical protein